MITAILNCYKRLNYLEEQIQAIENQTVKPADIWVWYNNPEDGSQINLNEKLQGKYKVIQSNHNFKFHGRFALGLLAQTKYIAFFDDDTIPGNKWFESCINTINGGEDGILGTAGIYIQKDTYNPHKKIGWNGIHNKETLEVDLVGQAWFMKKDYLRYLWYEDPINWENGEDMQLSYQAQKYGNVKTYVPPHPPEDHSLWGSLPEKGSIYGNDENANWSTKSNHRPIRDQIVNEQIKRGWVTVQNK